MKKCTRHSRYFPDLDPYLPATTEYFCKQKTYKNGLQSWCRKCVAEHNQRYNKTLNGRLHRIYHTINSRCNNPKNAIYKYYGGRGIKNLFTSVDDFINYVMYSLKITKFSQIDGLEIDRINNNGNYERGNIRFVTHKVNNNNKRTNRKK